MQMRRFWATTVFGALAILSLPLVARADCPPVGGLPNYRSADNKAIRAYQSYEFAVRKGDATETVTVAGHFCSESYGIADGVDVMSDLEIQLNYREQLKQMGAEILSEEGRDTYARLRKGGKESWIRIYSQENAIEVYVVDKQPLRLTLTKPSGNDYRLLGHMPGYEAGKPEKRNFDEYEFTVKEGDDARDVKVRGAKYFVNYSLKDGSPVASDLEIQENYRAAFQEMGAQMLSTSGRDTYARAEIGGQTIWFRVYSQENGVEVYVIEEKPFQASIKPAEANALKAALDKQGRVAIYVNFDFSKAALKPDAAPAIAQVVKLLKDNPALKLAIDGHTDNVGAHDYNMRLSEQRAAAVVDALVKQGISADRLASAGFGPDNPVGDNATDEGRAKNRRVELVKK